MYGCVRGGGGDDDGVCVSYIYMQTCGGQDMPGGGRGGGGTHLSIIDIKAVAQLAELAELRRHGATD